MEEKIESYIDNVLETIAPQLHIFNIIIATTLLLGGIIFIIWNRKKE